jgi:hypothetical protein
MARRRVRNRFVLIDDILVRTIVLPPTVSNAIQRKLEQEQMALEMQFRLSRERQEADRKRIEATGLRDYQETIASTLSNQLLEFKGIEATLELAKSNNAKIVVVGGGRNGLPLILNADTFAQPQAAGATDTRRPTASAAPPVAAPGAIAVVPPAVVVPPVTAVGPAAVPLEMKPAAGAPAAAAPAARAERPNPRVTSGP